MTKDRYSKKGGLPVGQIARVFTCQLPPERRGSVRRHIAGPVAGFENLRDELDRHSDFAEDVPASYDQLAVLLEDRKLVPGDILGGSDPPNAKPPLAELIRSIARSTDANSA